MLNGERSEPWSRSDPWAARAAAGSTVPRAAKPRAPTPACSSS